MQKGVQMREVRRTEKFDEGFWSLGKELQERVVRALEKLGEKPQLGKPLRSPLAGFFSERVGAIRVIYTYDEKEVVLRECRWRKKGY